MSALEDFFPGPAVQPRCAGCHHPADGQSGICPCGALDLNDYGSGWDDFGSAA